MDATTQPKYKLAPAQLISLITDLTAGDQYSFLDAKSHPALGASTVFNIPGTADEANLGRHLEAEVLQTSWGAPLDEICRWFESIESTSRFFLLIDQSAETPQLAGVLRVADCDRGHSETIEFFHEFYGAETALPGAIGRAIATPGTWEVVTVAVNPSFRNGRTSAWLYHALYRASLEADITDWIASVTPGELRNLRRSIGIPFIETPDCPPITETHTTADGRSKDVTFLFCTCDVSTVDITVRSKIEQYLSREGAQGGARSRLANTASIALWGRESR